MTFASLEFGLLLLVCLALFWLLPQRGRLILLLVASYVFYCYWHVYYGLLILVSTLVDYFAALAIQRSRIPRVRRLALLASVVANLGLLGYFKYTNFALDSLRILLGPLGSHIPGPLEILLPAGISFYTFQTMAYTIDVYRGTIRAERDFILMATFVAYFPQLVAGPIERSSELTPQLRERQTFEPRRFEEGLRLLLWGLVKKTVFSDRLGYAVYPLFVDPSTGAGPEFLVNSLAMLVVIYLDFSAYTDMARGTSLLFGIRLTRNFRSPFAALSIADFWQRWHITMSTWVRDYLYRPLGGFHPRNPWHHVRITLVTMGLVGLWHGAQWTYVVWGLLCGVALALYHLIAIHLLRRFRRHPFMANPLYPALTWALTMLVHAFNTTLFCAPDMARGLAYLRGLLTWPAGPLETPTLLLTLAAMAALWGKHLLLDRRDATALLDQRTPATRALAYLALFCLAYFGAVRGGEEFIYFQF